MLTYNPSVLMPDSLYQVHHVVPRIGTLASGPSYSVPRLCEALSKSRVSASLHVLDPVPDRKFSFPVINYPSLPFPSARLGVSPKMKRALSQLSQIQGIVIHNHSLWMMPNIYTGNSKQFRQSRLVCSPRGTLSQWSLNRARFRKKAMWLAGQKRMLYACDMLHATSEDELVDIRRLGLKSVPVAVIPNGIDMPSQREFARPSDSELRQIVFLSRIHPKKRVDQLLRCWQKIAAQREDWELVVYGPEDSHGYRKQMIELAQSNLIPRVSFPGPVYGEEKWRSLQKAEVFVLPTHSENFGLAVAEALACGTPCIVTKGAPWEGLETKRCGWWIEHDDSALESALLDATSKPSAQLCEMGGRGREWMQRDYAWDQIAQKMLQSYQWMMTGGDLPECIALN